VVKTHYFDLRPPVWPEVLFGQRRLRTGGMLVDQVQAMESDDDGLTWIWMRSDMMTVAMKFKTGLVGIGCERPLESQ
jgi:hypothetical protein